MEQREFPTWVLFSITSGVLCKGDFPKVHEAIEWLTGHPVWTHQLPRESIALRAPLAAQNPLFSLRVPDDLEAPHETLQWAREQLEQYPATLVVHRCPTEFRDPFGELAEMVGPEKIITVAT